MNEPCPHGNLFEAVSMFELTKSDPSIAYLTSASFDLCAQWTVVPYDIPYIPLSTSLVA